jgi:hypothetical protein
MKNDPEVAVPPPAPDGSLRYVRPTKEAMRSWLRRVIAARRPPPGMQDIQDELWYVPRSQGLKDGP